MRIVGPMLAAEIDLARGAKIVSLRDVSNTEWLAQADRGRTVPVGASFVEAEMSGWDECAPTIVECLVGRSSVPDHGDLWNAQFEAGALPGSTLTTGTSLDYRFQRTVSAIPGGLRLHYSAEALTRDVPFLWAAHPQFLAPEGTSIQLGDHPGDVPVVDVLSPELPRSLWRHDTPVMTGVERHGCRKYYVAPDHRVTSATIRRPSGHALTLRWSAQSPYLGVWIDNCAYSREPVVALEPSTGYFDSLATAVRNGTSVTLVPGEPVMWWVELEVSVPGDAGA